MGQVYHSLGKAAEAIAEYTAWKIALRTPSRRSNTSPARRLSLPEVTTVKPGETAEPELKFRNVAAADVQVYRIDLMKFSLLKRNLAGITEINLAGIRPLARTRSRTGRRQRLPRPHAKTLAAAEGRRRVPGRLPRR